MGGERIEPKRFRLIVDQRGYTYRDVARGLRVRGVLVSTEQVARLGHEPPARPPDYVDELARLLKTKAGFLVGEHGQFMAKRFRELHGERGCTLSRLAGDLAGWNVNVTPQYLQQLSTGRNTNPRQEIVDSVACLLGTTPEYLTGLSDDPGDGEPGDGEPVPWARLAARGGLDGLPPDLRRIIAVIAHQESEEAAPPE